MENYKINVNEQELRLLISALNLLSVNCLVDTDVVQLHDRLVNEKEFKEELKRNNRKNINNLK